MSFGLRVLCRAALFVMAVGMASSGCSTTSSEGLPHEDKDASGPVDAPTNGHLDAPTDPANTRGDALAGCFDASVSVRRALGQSCACNNECLSGFCVDRLCCDSACDGVCRACNIASSPGTCTPIPAGKAPVVAGQCKQDTVATCGFDGTCSGTGACRKYPDGTVCMPGRCQGNSVSGTMVCTAGVCKAGPTELCTPYVCNNATNKCFSSCTSTSQCDGRVCAGGSCGKKPLGAVCRDRAECASNFCADGVCCNLACSGACVSCNQVGKTGECRPVTSGSADPHSVCPKEAVTTCGHSGLCNGEGGCAKYVLGTVCGAASCSAGSHIPASTCNGLGTCQKGSPINCYPYVCSGDLCRAACTTNSDCASPTICNKGSCGKKGLGQKCATGVECKSNFCVDGVCCDQSCTGTCSFCAFSSSPGRCVKVPAGVSDPRMGCIDRGAASCATNGKCNGAGACQQYATGTVCRAETCDATTNRYTQEGTCHSGVCASASPSSCAPHKCNGTRCANSCSANSQCVSPNVCVDSSCGLRPNGALCSRADECKSGFCSQGVCCGTACSSSCFSCNLPGTAGMCLPVPAGGMDPAAACRDQGTGSCGNDGMCNGTGGCRKYASGTVCVAAVCTSGDAKANSTCDGKGTCVTGATRACSPYVCNAAGTDCYSSCSDNTQCIATRTCDMGMCGRKNDGANCAEDDECKSTFCVDGVCCNSECSGVCKSCSLGTPGVCGNISAGIADDSGGCPPSAESTCGNDGTCNGAGGCRKWGTSIMCRVGSCPANASTWTKPANCDGNGNCPQGQMQTCGNYRCDATTTMCKIMCTSDADCVAGKACDAQGTCGKNANGSSCNSDTECASSQCVDNTCCASASCGTCKTCANSSGTCANVPNDQSDSDSCTDETSTNQCGTIGKCDGAGNCKQAPSGTGCSVCSADQTSVIVQACNGSGTCTDSGSTMSCNGYQCSNAACLQSCDPEPCFLGKVCVDNKCEDPPLPEPALDADLPEVVPDAGADDAPADDPGTDL